MPLGSFFRPIFKGHKVDFIDIIREEWKRELDLLNFPKMFKFLKRGEDMGVKIILHFSLFLVLLQ